MFVHSVFFYLRPDLTSAQREEFLKEGLESLRAVPSIKAAYIGAPAGIPPRPVVDLSFSFSLTILFDDVAGHNAYQADPIHLAFIARFKGCWSRVQIYDAE
ncbi:MAG: Dabb family protein [Verrucomicrobia bacterium]|nr:Dabb family protein [Verrucomicrobiota bacterium]